MLRETSQGESSVMRVRLEGRKKPIRHHKKNHYEYALAGSEYTLTRSEYALARCEYAS